MGYVAELGRGSQLLLTYNAGRYILATEEEMRDQWPDEWEEFWEEARGGYVVGFDMLHTLHCVVCIPHVNHLLWNRKLI
jgi:hypothetical protein